MTPAQKLRQKIEAALTGQPDIFVYKPMFGGIRVYGGGKYFASLSDVGLALKVSKADATQLLELGRKWLQYEPDSPVSKSYVVLPDDIVEKPEALATWVERSLEFVHKR